MPTTFKKPSARCRRCQTRYRQEDGLCRRCAAEVAGFKAQERNTQSVSGWKGLHGEAQRSWWLDCDRPTFDAKLQEELPRMARSSIAHALKPEVKDHAGW